MFIIVPDESFPIIFLDGASELAGRLTYIHYLVPSFLFLWSLLSMQLPIVLGHVEPFFYALLFPPAFISPHK